MLHKSKVIESNRCTQCYCLLCVYKILSKEKYFFFFEFFNLRNYDDANEMKIIVQSQAKENMKIYVTKEND